MPGLNGRGPASQGSRTGRGMGKCKPNAQKDEDMNQENDSSDNQQAFGGMRRKGRGNGQGGRGRFGNGKGNGNQVGN